MTQSCWLFFSLFPLWLTSTVVALQRLRPPNTHQIHDLPGYNDSTPIDFKHYAGRLPLPSSGQELFYWLVESQDDPATDPIVLWLNGGPGCSSLGGFFTELGPFVVQSDLTVKRNNYAGRYIPFLITKLLASPLPKVHLVGFLIGNPSTNYEIDHNSYVDYYYTHGLISLENYMAVGAACGDNVGRCVVSSANCSAACEAALQDGILSIDEPALNRYYIYGDVCLLNKSQAHPLKYRNLRPPFTPLSDAVTTPCTNTFTQEYLRQPLVQEALHLSHLKSVGWRHCSNAVGHMYVRSSSSMELYPAILTAGIKALIYSGDADMVVNFMGTQRWISTEGLGLKVTDKWRAWFGPDKQLAGYSEEYAGGLTFKTVKGAGHMVPAVRPLHALYMFECFALGHDACNNFTYPRNSAECLTGEDLDACFGDGSDTVDLPHPANHVNWSLYGILIVLVGIAVAMLTKLRLDYRKKQYAML
ncbi:hypothetical protein H257_11225 [Aphanomyces astaci]|uniref:Uncharacterized protein n=1 Tax=Aphanomyces astaci TaxID=112090 RepID=W4G4T8_APHAT|nr:hypothetical protein H257_11225 [Aphanomyces astaci]ETV74301.1 hypothetical protein H257_11225 [Aphanomyces astaci]|eukprot:XP_009836407.1 hypothetical protein H257_11225 [Aphanomyces astaci]